MEEMDFHSGFIALIGRPNVGKSTLLNRILGQKVAITSNKPQTTRNRILGIHTTERAQLLFLDTPGLHQAKGNLNRYMVEQATTACSGVDLVLLLTEAGTPLPEPDEPVRRLLGSLKVPISLVINKIDRVAKPALLGQIDAWRQLHDFRDIFPVSALSGNGVDAMVTLLENQLPPGPPYYPEDMVTDLPERFIAAEMVREKVMRRTRDEVPYGVAVTVDQFEEKPGRNLVALHATIHVERDSHKRILIGKGGQMLKAIGQDARREIERFLGTRVFLDLFVKVQPDWTRSERLLRDLGYH